ncbi:hypothetical protein G4G27_06170 [Sphingomonas sp. So64.6b]|uniref:DUF7684 family protein n=1 Tax=Sphingomonas sp. So64.6b TaxID=2997354 RepID=UPI001603D724|nr:hypothetical protein [Sphingomonas sp. So64.6b]QNA83627.1 hypothetical protein G4G27_06170 [Sphingomonas sp. So64.6b]
MRYDLTMSAASYVHLMSGEPLPRLSLPPFKAIIVAEDTADNGWRDEVSKVSVTVYLTPKLVKRAAFS